MYRWDCTVWKKVATEGNVTRMLRDITAQGRGDRRKRTWNSGNALGSSSFAYERAHTPWNQESTCITIVLMLYTHAVIDRHLHAWKRHQAKPSRTFHRCWSTWRSSYCRKHIVCIGTNGRLKRWSTSIAEAMLKVNKYNTCDSWSCNIIYVLQCVQ